MHRFTKNRPAPVINGSGVIEFSGRSCSIPGRYGLRGATIHGELNLGFATRFGHVGNCKLPGSGHALKRNYSDTLELESFINRSTLNPIRLPDKFNGRFGRGEVLTINEKNAG